MCHVELQINIILNDWCKHYMQSFTSRSTVTVGSIACPVCCHYNNNNIAIMKLLTFSYDCCVNKPSNICQSTLFCFWKTSQLHSRSHHIQYFNCFLFLFNTKMSTRQKNAQSSERITFAKNESSEMLTAPSTVTSLKIHVRQFDLILMTAVRA